MTSHQLIVASDILGFISGFALSIQSVRLIRHLRAVRNLRNTAVRTSGRTAELALQGADTLEKTITRWDSLDQVLVIIGFVGLTASFLLKLASLMLE